MKEMVFNTGETQQDLRQTYNPDGSNLRRAQLRLLEMATYLMDACQQAGVHCRIDSGNVLGALRHGGFIPWDDDFDVVVSYAEYPKLIRYLTTHPHPEFVFQNHDTDPDSFQTWGRLRDLKTRYEFIDDAMSREGKAAAMQEYQGLQIDIFPYEQAVIPWLHRLSGKMACRICFDVAPRSKAVGNLLFGIMRKVLFPLFRAVGRLFGNREMYMHAYGTCFYKRVPKAVLLPHRPIVFEGSTFPGPADPEAYCRIIYGDYMQLPEKEKRQVHSLRVKFLDDESS